MAPKAKAVETKTGFGALSADNKKWMESLEEKGWLFEFDAEAGWSGKRKGDHDETLEVGPSDSFMVMINLAESADKESAGRVKEVDGSGLKKLTHDVKGQGYLPGSEPIVVEELVMVAKAYEDAKRARMKLTAEEKQRKNDLENIGHKYIEHFTLADDGTYVYHAAGIKIVREIEEVEKFKTSLDDPDEDE